MYDHYSDIKNIKKTSWSKHNEIKATTGKWYSVTSIINAMKPVVDFDEIAEKCSVNPSHEMFGKTVEEIRTEWKARGLKGKNNGRLLDNFIQFKLHKIPFKYPEGITSEDITEETKQKFQSFVNLYEDVLLPSKIVPTACELWVNSSTGVRGKLDELFYVPSYNGYLIADWKNTEKIGTFSNKHMLGCLSHLQSCEIIEYYLQVYIYWYILEKEYNIPVKSSKIFQITKGGYFMPVPKNFKYDRELIAQVITEAKQKINEQEQ